MIYTICMTLFLVGALGLAAQLIFGGLHAGHGAQAGHASHGHFGTHHSSSHGHGHGQTNGQAHGHGTDAGRTSAQWLLTVLSPLTIFSVCLGAGAAGLLLRGAHLPLVMVAVSAFVAGVAFYGLVVRPAWNLVFRFASKPSETLAGVLARDAEVVTSFNELGQGVVRLSVDGQSVRVLATLESDDRAHATDIAPGDHLTVTGVDGERNTCRVSRLLE